MPNLCMFAMTSGCLHRISSTPVIPTGQIHRDIEEGNDSWRAPACASTWGWRSGVLAVSSQTDGGLLVVSA